MVDTHALPRVETVPEPYELWDPGRDPLGTAAGTDIEPLQAGMAEIDCKQLGICDMIPGFVRREAKESVPVPWRPVVAPESKHERSAPPLLVARCPDELGSRIESEIDDYEIEAACEAPGLTE